MALNYCLCVWQEMGELYKNSNEYVFVIRRG